MFCLYNLLRYDLLALRFSLRFSPWKRRKPFRLTKARYPPKRLCLRAWVVDEEGGLAPCAMVFKALIGTCDAGPKPPLTGTGPNLIRPGTCFSDFRYRFKSVLRNSGRICLANRSQGYLTGIPHPPPKRPAFNFKYVRLAVSVPRLAKADRCCASSSKGKDRSKDVPATAIVLPTFQKTRFLQNRI